MHVLVLATLHTLLCLLPSDTGPEALETHADFVPVEQDDVSDRAGVDAEECTVHHRVGSTEVGSRVVHVFLVVVKSSIIQGTTDVVQLTEVVEHSVGVDRKIAGVPCIGVIDPQCYDTPKKHTKALVQCGKCGHHLLTRMSDRASETTASLEH